MMRVKGFADYGRNSCLDVLISIPAVGVMQGFSWQKGFQQPAKKATPSGQLNMTKKSAGILLYRIHKGAPEFFLVHPGGPFWRNKDAGAWSIPKGEFEEGEDPLQTAIRELQEETGMTVEGNFIALTPVKQKGGKIVYAWALHKNVDPGKVKSNSFEIEWPPHSGRRSSFPEIDRADWFPILLAREKINSGQLPLLREL